MSANAATIAANLAHVRERIARASTRAARRSGRGPAKVKIIAVSKTFSAAAIRAAYDAGVRDFGENRVQEWESKRAQLLDLDATFHMLGHVQSNKVSRVVQLFHRVDSLDRLGLAQKLDSAAAADNKLLPVLIEVRLSGEESKTGVAETDLASLAEATESLAHLDLQGLMTIPPYFDDAERARAYFRKLRELRDGLSAKIGRELPVLSMGMSHDFEVAIEEGATEVRIGTAIFGDRELRA
jgi:pyridoxal phosphate enzyme (YggS family)